jgi:hypothetical protein
MSSIFRKDPVCICVYEECHQLLWDKMVKDISEDLRRKLVDISRDINAKWRDTDLGPHTTLKYGGGNIG